MRVRHVLGYRLLVKREEVKSESGLILPDEVKSLKALRGTIVQLGPKAFDSGLMVGDKIAWAKYTDCVEIDTDDGVFVVMNAEDVLLTLN